MKKAGIYRPSEDSFLLAECVKQYRGKWALEIGVGSGVVTKVLAENFQNVAGSDIDFDALKLCKQQGIEFLPVCCDAASAFHTKFDMVVTNPPYLPGNPEMDPTVHGGDSGVDTTIHFLSSALPCMAGRGKMLVVISSLADAAKLDKVIGSMKMKRKMIKEKKLFFETLCVYELSR